MAKQTSKTSSKKTTPKIEEVKKQETQSFEKDLEENIIGNTIENENTSGVDATQILDIDVKPETNIVSPNTDAEKDLENAEEKHTTENKPKIVTNNNTNRSVYGYDHFGMIYGY